MGSMFSLNNPEYQPSFSGGVSSRLSDYSSEDKDDADTLLLTCQFHGLTLDDINGFEEHQISEHTVRGEFCVAFVINCTQRSTFGETISKPLI